MKTKNISFTKTMYAFMNNPFFTIHNHCLNLVGLVLKGPSSLSFHKFNFYLVTTCLKSSSHTVILF